MTDKENGKNVEGGPWWVRLVKKLRDVLPKRRRKSGDDTKKAIENRDGTDESPHILRPDKTTGWFYLAVSGCLASVVTWESFRAVTLDSNGWLPSGLKTVSDVLSHSGQAMTAVALWSAILAELGRLFMVLARYVEKDLKRKLVENSKRRQEKADEKAAKKGRAELEAEVQAWYKRQQEALAKGDPFDEPPPGVGQEESAD